MIVAAIIFSVIILAAVVGLHRARPDTLAEEEALLRDEFRRRDLDGS